MSEYSFFRAYIPGVGFLDLGTGISRTQSSCNHLVVVLVCGHLYLLFYMPQFSTDLHETLHADTTHPYAEKTRSGFFNFDKVSKKLPAAILIKIIGTS